MKWDIKGGPSFCRLTAQGDFLPLGQKENDVVLDFSVVHSVPYFGGEKNLSINRWLVFMPDFSIETCSDQCAHTTAATQRLERYSAPMWQAVSVL